MKELYYIFPFALPPTTPAHAPRSKRRPLPAISPPRAIHPRIRHSHVPTHIWGRTRVRRVRGGGSAATAARVAVSGIATA